MIKNLNQFDIIIQSLKDGNLDFSLNKIKKISITNSNEHLISKLLASIYFKKKKLGKLNQILSKNVIF